MQRSFVCLEMSEKFLVAMILHTVCMCVFMMSHWLHVALVDVSSPKHCPNMDMRGKGDRLWFTRLECANVHSQHVCRTLYRRSNGVEDFEGGADVRADPSDVLLFSTHVAILRTTGLFRGNEREREIGPLRNMSSWYDMELYSPHWKKAYFFCYIFIT